MVHVAGFMSIFPVCSTLGFYQSEKHLHAGNRLNRLAAIFYLVYIRSKIMFNLVNVNESKYFKCLRKFECQSESNGAKHIKPSLMCCTNDGNNNNNDNVKTTKCT